MLKESEFCAFGTIKENRMAKCPLKSLKDTEKKSKEDSWTIDLMKTMKFLQECKESTLAFFMDPSYNLFHALNKA
ncbi:hypothetical protein AVEN_163845-1, partial [Araneus ventricosus]